MAGIEVEPAQRSQPPRKKGVLEQAGAVTPPELDDPNARYQAGNAHRMRRRMLTSVCAWCRQQRQIGLDAWVGGTVDHCRRPAGNERHGQSGERDPSR
jgi:hypothetical protein